jgi:hypothetical protein
MSRESRSSGDDITFCSNSRVIILPVPVPYYFLKVVGSSLIFWERAIQIIIFCKMFGFGTVSAALLAAAAASSSSGTNKYSFQDERLQGALELYKEGQQLTVEGNYQEACDVFMLGIFMGRKTVQSLLQQGGQDDGSSEDDPQLALDWMISSYLACAEAHIQIGDWQTARADAWAACTYSQNSNRQALEIMLTVCEKTDDALGQFSALKSILELSESTIEADEMIQQRITALEEELKKRFS